MTAEAAETVFTAWPVVAAAVTVTGGLLVVILTHHFTRRRELQMLEEKRRREKEDAVEKREAEFRYISTELIFRLEEFAQKCALVAADYGVALREDAELVASVSEPELMLEDIDGEWKSVPPELLYFIRELPVRLRAVGPVLDEVYDNLWDPPENGPWFDERQKQYARIGLSAIRLARRLRRLGGYPETRLAGGPHSAMQVMWKVYRRELRHRQIINLATNVSRQASEVS
ncbi:MULTISPECIES: hypothetical protein [Erwinia]|uniref:hypothetical protein n=1 Tax=Erwinia TaxID=551 RepID=UPI001060052C|nr:hypothetical protein [Erwinia aphidicola]MCP2234034.1 hypothetical protein [Erwinia aphidicola]